MSRHKTCEICGKKKATSLHHRAGRRGENMFRLFMALCRRCHEEIHEHPGDAKAKGYIVKLDGSIEIINEEDYKIEGLYLNQKTPKLIVVKDV